MLYSRTKSECLQQCGRYASQADGTEALSCGSPNVCPTEIEWLARHKWDRTTSVLIDSLAASVESSPFNSTRLHVPCSLVPVHSTRTVFRRRKFAGDQNGSEFSGSTTGKVWLTDSLRRRHATCIDGVAHSGGGCLQLCSDLLPFARPASGRACLSLIHRAFYRHDSSAGIQEPTFVGGLH